MIYDFLIGLQYTKGMSFLVMKNCRFLSFSLLKNSEPIWYFSSSSEEELSS
jgi:hypothetical protein